MALTDEQRAELRAKALEKLKKTRDSLAQQRKSPSTNIPVAPAQVQAQAPPVTPASHQQDNGKAKVPASLRNAQDMDPLPPVSDKFKNYIDYDFSKMKDSKGGFLVDEDMSNANTNRLSLEEWQQKKRLQEAPLPLDHPDAPRCFECGSAELDFKLYYVFKCRVCRDCRMKYRDKYSLLTKTECKEDYLLTDPELADEELLSRMEKPNPHKTTYNNMMLFLRYQVEEYAFKKWGGPEALDAEYERRVNDKRLRKEKKFLQKIRDMRRKTRAENYTKSRQQKHTHSWIELTEGTPTTTSDADVSNDSNIKSLRCTLCGMTKEELVI